MIWFRPSRTPRNELADEQTLAEHGPLFKQSGDSLFDAIGHELAQLFSGAQEFLADNPLADWLRHLKGDANALIAHILNTFAYNELKIRAGVVGKGLARDVLDHLIASGKRIHLVGHSFGGRVMAAATATVAGKIANLTFLEGAFSQNSLSEDLTDPETPVPGAFRSIIIQEKVSGRITAAHSAHDTAVWIAYPLASRVFRDSSYFGPAGPLGDVFGGATDRYGAIGANGPQNLPGVDVRFFDGRTMPELKPGVHSLECGSFVSSHTDVWNQGSAFIVAAGLLAD